MFSDSLRISVQYIVHCYSDHFKSGPKPRVTIGAAVRLAETRTAVHSTRKKSTTKNSHSLVDILCEHFTFSNLLGSFYDLKSLHRPWLIIDFAKHNRRTFFGLCVVKSPVNEINNGIRIIEEKISPSRSCRREVCMVLYTTTTLRLLTIYSMLLSL